MRKLAFIDQESIGNLNTKLVNPKFEYLFPIQDIWCTAELYGPTLVVLVFIESDFRGFSWAFAHGPGVSQTVNQLINCGEVAYLGLRVHNPTLLSWVEFFFNHAPLWKYFVRCVQPSLQCQVLFILAQAACVRHPRWRLQCIASHCYYLRSVHFFLRLLLLTYFGDSPVCENLFPPKFWHN